MNKKKWSALFLAGTLIMAGCSSTTAQTGSSTEQGTYVAGTYTGESENGKNGTVAVSVTFSNDAIEFIEVTEQNETESIASAALEQIPAEVVQYQSLGVDAVSGATITSNALLEAIADAVTQAGGDAEALANVEIEKTVSTETVTMNADVVVVGLGAAGMSAAMSAADNGASVIVIEKQSSIGGNAIVSGGYIDTTLLEDLHLDNNESYTNKIEAFLEAGPQTDAEAEVWDELEQDYAEYVESGNTKVYDSEIFWAIDFARLEGGDYSGTDYQDSVNGFVEWFTEETGAEWTEFAGIVGYTWPRWTSLKGYYSGQGYFDLFENWIKETDADITIITSTQATELIQDEEGTVTGVVGVNEDGTTYNVYGSDGVVLCTGGFAYNREMVKEYDGIWGDLLTEDIMTTNTAGATGDGIVMAQAVGAATADLDNTMLFPLADVKTASTEAIVGQTASLLMVNQEGNRFCDETASRYEISGAMLAQTNQIAYAISCEANSLIEDGKTTGGTDIESMIANGELYRADTLEELAEMAGIPYENLQVTIDAYNEMCETYIDEEFGRQTFEPGSEIADGPYYAYPCAVATHITIGGVVADANGQVYDEAGNVIQGLYAAGEVTDGNCGIDGSFGAGMVTGLYITSK